MAAAPATTMMTTTAAITTAMVVEFDPLSESESGCAVGIPLVDASDKVLSACVTCCFLVSTSAWSVYVYVLVARRSADMHIRARDDSII